MSVTTSHLHGAFCWVELCSGDAPSSNAFYSGLFGWAAEEIRMPDGSYTMYKLGDAGVAGMYQMAEERKQAGIRPHWNLYISVSDMDGAVEQASALGKGAYAALRCRHRSHGQSTGP